MKLWNHQGHYLFLAIYSLVMQWYNQHLQLPFPGNTIQQTTATLKTMQARAA